MRNEPRSAIVAASRAGARGRVKPCRATDGNDARDIHGGARPPMPARPAGQPRTPRAATALRQAALAAAMVLSMAGAMAGGAAALEAREGWTVHSSTKSYAEMLEALRAAVRDNAMAVVTEAGPTGAAAARGVSIPGNRVLGVFRNDFAVRTLALSEAAMIEAPIRFYVTERPDGTATLSFKRPGAVLAPYADEGGAALAAIGAELDAIFDAIAADALR